MGNGAGAGRSEDCNLPPWLSSYSHSGHTRQYTRQERTLIWELKTLGFINLCPAIYLLSVVSSEMVLESSFLPVGTSLPGMSGEAPETWLVNKPHLSGKAELNKIPMGPSPRLGKQWTLTGEGDRPVKVPGGDSQTWVVYKPWEEFQGCSFH